MKEKDFFDEERLCLVGEIVARRCLARLKPSLPENEKMEIICEQCDKVIGEDGKVFDHGLTIYTEEAQAVFDFLYDYVTWLVG